MSPEAVLGALDRLIGDAPPCERAGLIVALAARLAALGANLTGPPDSTELPDENLSAQEAARRLGVSRDWLYKTDVPFKLKIGRRVLFSAHGLERWNRQRIGR